MKKFYDADPGDKVGKGRSLEGTGRPLEEARPGYMAPEVLERDEAIKKMQEVTFKTLKDMRVTVDSLSLTTTALLPASRFRSMAITAFDSSRQFLGVILGERGAKYPYPSLADNTNKVSGARADQGKVLEEVRDLEDDVVLMCKKLREITEDTITELEVFIDSYPPSGVKDHYVSGRALTDLISAKMQLGEILGEIASNQSSEQPK